MYAPDTIETIGLNQCHVCSSELLDRDKFCRRCGASQSSHIDQTVDITGRAALSDLETRPSSGGGPLRRSYSDPLIRIVTRELSQRTSPFRANRWAIRLVSALVAVPLWLMIVLLSPLDAVVAAKAVARQV